MTSLLLLPLNIRFIPDEYKFVVMLFLVFDALFLISVIFGFLWIAFKSK